METVTLDSSKFSIKTEAFEGPLELLIELVEKRKLLINDISLAAVTDEYMKTVSHMQELSLPNTAEFVRLAATLLLIKSKSLLPALDLTTEETEDIAQLEDRLAQYQIYRQAADVVQQHFGSRPLLAVQIKQTHPIRFTPDTYCTTEALARTAYALSTELPLPEQRVTAQVKPVISLEEMIERVKHRIEQQFNCRFSELIHQIEDRKTVAVSFLAILELTKQAHVTVQQTEHFADIDIERAKAGTPTYY